MTTLKIDLPVLLESRMLLQANSGGGKSWALRWLLEHTADQVQQLVLDPEGEFATLRERFDYIVCAPREADAVATPATAAALARALWESGSSAIVDIYELKAHERASFVRRFCEALIAAPRRMWHSTLVVIDEVHIFAPQVGKAESAGAVIDLATRGRKRGLSLLGATQRISKLHKDVAAELLNKLIGRTGLDIDVARAADELGMARRDAQPVLRGLEPGEFFKFGPALSRAVERVRIGPVTTTHPRTGQRALSAPPPASPAILAKLAKIEGLQREAEAEEKSVETLTAEVATLRRKLAAAERAGPASGITEAEVERRVAAALAAAQPSPVVITGLDQAAAAVESVRRALLDRAPAQAPAPGLRPAAPPRATSAAAAPPKASAAPSAAGLTGPEQRILDAIAWLESLGVDKPEQPAVAFLAGYTYGGGAFNNPRGRLHQRGLVEYVAGNSIRLTEAGRAAANRPAAPASDDELHARVLARLPGPEQRLLRPLLAAYPQAMSNADLAAAAGYTPGAGAFNNPRGRLRSLGLVEYPQPGWVAARALLFPPPRD